MSNAQNILSDLSDVVVQVDDLMGAVRRSLAELDKEHGTKLFTPERCKDINKAADLVQQVMVHARRDVWNVQHPV
jgi:hypothetical protein